MLKLMLLMVMIIGVLPLDHWKSDSTNSKISFSVKGPFGTVNGNFSGLKTEIQFDEKNLTGSSIVASIETNTVNTGIGLRNRDLRKKEEWFNTDKYPQMIFHSKNIEKTTAGFTALGDLTIKGVSKSTGIPFTFSSQGDSGLFKGQFTIKREDFNVGSKTGSSVGSIITITLDVPVKK